MFSCTLLEAHYFSLVFFYSLNYSRPFRKWKVNCFLLLPLFFWLKNTKLTITNCTRCIETGSALFLPCFGYSHYPFKPIKANLRFKRNHGRWLLQLHSLGQYFLSVNIANWIKPSSRPRGCNWGHEGKTKENEQKPVPLSGRVSALFFFFVHPMFSYLCKIKCVCRTLTTFHGPK